MAPGPVASPHAAANPDIIAFSTPFLSTVAENVGFQCHRTKVKPKSLVAPLWLAAVSQTHPPTPRLVD